MIFKHKITVVVVMALLSICCCPSIYKPTIADVDAGKKLYSDLTIEQLNKGMRLYSDKCASCHRLFKPKEITTERWAEMLPEMKEKAKLTDTEYELITRYLKSKNTNPD